MFCVHVEILINVVLRLGCNQFGKILVHAMRAFLLYSVKLLHFFLSFSFALIFALAVFIYLEEMLEMCVNRQNDHGHQR